MNKHVVGIRQVQHDERRRPRHYSSPKNGRQLSLFEDKWLWSEWQAICDDCDVLTQHPTRAGAESAAMMHYKLSVVGGRNV